MADTATSTFVFAGVFRHQLDDKKRTTIPSKWRQNKEGDDFFLVPHPTNPCLLVMPPEEFEAVGERVKGSQQVTSKKQSNFIRQFYSNAQNCSTDKQGRLLLPEEHRSEIGLGDEVVLVGSRERFEIWNPAKWTAFKEAEAESYRKVADLVGL